MAIRYYDQALTEKIKGWVKDPNLNVLSPNDTSRLFQMKLDQNNDRPLNLPFVALSRDSDIEIISTQRRPLTYDGASLEATKRTTKILNAIPIKLSYQLDIYTRYFAEADEYTRNFIFNFINYPGLHIELPYNDSNIVHDSTVLIESTVSDNSDIQERLIKDQFTRMTLKLTIDDAYLFSIPFKDNWKVELSETYQASDEITKEVQTTMGSGLVIVEPDMTDPTKTIIL